MTTEVTAVENGKVVHAARIEGKPGETVFNLVDNAVTHNCSGGFAEVWAGPRGEMAAHPEFVDAMRTGEAVGRRERAFEGSRNLAVRAGAERSLAW